MKITILLLTIITINLLSSDIERSCRGEWGTNYRMVKYCINEQTKARNNINPYNNNSGVERNCRDQWGTNYRMVKYCINEQTKARNSINESNTDADAQIEGYCRGTWDTNYRMVKYCINDLTSTKDSLKANGLVFMRVDNGEIVAQSISNAEKEKRRIEQQNKQVEQKNRVALQRSRIKKQNKETEQRTPKITKAEYTAILKKQYKDTPTLYVQGRTIYNVQDINYFRKDKTKIMIRGKERSYFFPIKVLKEAKFENATKELEQKLNSLINNESVK